MATIDTQKFKTQLDAVKQARTAWKELPVPQHPQDAAAHQTQENRLRQAYYDATTALAWEVQQQIERAEEMLCDLQPPVVGDNQGFGRTGG